MLKEKKGFTISIWADIHKDGDKFFATFPALPGLIVDGKTIDQIEERLEDCLVVHLNMLAKYEEPLPIGENLTVEILEEDEDIIFSHLGSPSPHSNPESWKKITWPTQKMLETS